MFLLWAMVPAVIAVWALRGRFERLADLRFRHLWLIWAALGAQIVLFTPLGAGLSDGTVRLAHSLTYLPLLGFLFMNWKLGVGLVAMGATSNFVAITANGGAMPADPVAQQVVFGTTEIVARQNTDAGADRLLFLGDVMALPSWFPLTNAFSVGDLLLAIGLVWALVRATVDAEAPAPLRSLRLIHERLASPDTSRIVGGLIGVWVALGAIVGSALANRAPALVALAMVAAFAPRFVGDTTWATHGPALAGLAGIGVAAAGLMADVWPAVAVGVTSLAAGAVLRDTSGGASLSGWPLPAHLIAAIAGLPIGAVLVEIAGLPGTLLACGAALIALALAAPTVNHALSPARGAVAVSSKTVRIASALALGLAALGALAVAVPTYGIVSLDMNAGSAGALAGACAFGAGFGFRMATVVRPAPDRRAIGMLAAFGGLAIGLMATAWLPMTYLGAAFVLGISLGAATWILRAGVAPQLAPLLCSAFAAGGAIGAFADPRMAPQLMWSACALFVAAGTILAVESVRVPVAAAAEVVA